MSNKSVLIIILIISALTLQLELLQTRIFSVALWHNFVYIVITMALLGFAASGTALSVFSRLRRMSNRTFYFLCLTGFSVTSYLSFRFTHYSVSDFLSLLPGRSLILTILIYYTISMLPYFFAGLAIGGSFIRFPNMTSILYFANLLGSGLGCLLFVLLIGHFGGPQLLLLSSLCCVILAIPIIRGNKRAQVVVLFWIVFLLVALFSPEDSGLKQVLPESHKQFWTLFPGGKEVEYSKWNPISRIDVISNSKFPRLKHIVMDGDATAMLYDRELIGQMLRRGEVRDRELPYFLLNRPADRALVIGAGGGFEVWIAALKGAREIDAVEINPTTANIASEIYSEHNNNIFSAGNVNLFIEDGRGFIKRAEKEYDVIVLYATDSLLALSTGAYVLSDAYIYTKDAFVDYLEHLSKDGYIHIGRWYFHKKPRETLRNFATALTACRDMGYEDPASHVIVVAKPPYWANVIFKKSPFSGQEKERLRLFCSKNRLVVLFPDDISPLYKDQKHLSPFSALAEAFSTNDEEKFYKQYFYNVSPVTDDSPFFYQCDKWYGQKKEWQRQKKVGDLDPMFYDDETIEIFSSHLILPKLLMHATILSLILVLLPLVVSRKSIGKYVPRSFIVIYFLSIGFGFMLFEMSIIQQFILFLGHPVYSIAVVVPAVLIFAGLGSLASYWLRRNIKLYMGIATFVCAFLIFVTGCIISNISNIFLSHPLHIRIIAAILTILPIAFCMGFPFPLAIRAISKYSQEPIPWAWAVNGASSVIASIIAVILAMQFGFKMVLFISVGLYVIAALGSLLFFKKT